MNMEGHELLGKMNRVEAPADFEGRVLARLGAERRARARRQTAFRFAFAGSAAVLLIGVALLNVPSVNRRAGSVVAGKNRVGTVLPQIAYPAAGREAGAASYLPVLETVDYSSEFRNASYQPRTVYILEQVSEVRPTEIKY
jgi:hypothetical protein